MSQVIRLEHVWTRFNTVDVHRDISFSVPEGAILGLVGASGCGKTVLMREMLGLQAPSRGEVILLGQNLQRVATGTRQALRNRCGVLFQGGALFSALNVFDNVAFPLRELGALDETTIRRLVFLKLSMVGLVAADAGLMPAELSGGMTKRVALARALIMEPELLFLDEPTSGLDPVTGERFVGLLSELHRMLGFSVVLVTHDLDTLRDVCTLVAVLADQRLVAFGTLAEVMGAEHPFAREYFHGRRAGRALAGGGHDG